MSSPAVTATAVEPPLADGRAPAIVRIEYEPDTLKIRLLDSPASEEFSVVVNDVLSFRVVDEGDLSTFWRSFTSRGGWLFEIHSGGWLSEEMARPGCLIGVRQPLPLEFLVLGQDACVSLLSNERPIVHAL